MVMQIRRTPTANNQPTGLSEGQLAVEMASNPPRLWVGVPTAIDASGVKLLVPSGGTASGTTAPTNPHTGDLWFDTNTGINQLKMWSGSAWVVVGGIADAPADGSLYGRVDGTWQLMFVAAGDQEVWVFTTPGVDSFTTPMDSSIYTTYRFHMQAGGGGGGGCTASGGLFPGSAGAGGEYKEFLISGLAANISCALSIGAGGAGSAITAVLSGTAGDVSTLTVAATGTNVVCNGGGGGWWNGTPRANWQALGGFGGAFAAGTATLQALLTIGGQDGVAPVQSTQLPNGGSSYYGQAAPAFDSTTGQPPTSAKGYGSGGAGAFITATNGLAGAPGIIIIERVRG